LTDSKVVLELIDSHTMDKNRKDPANLECNFSPEGQNYWPFHCLSFTVLRYSATNAGYAILCHSDSGLFIDMDKIIHFWSCLRHKYLYIYITSIHLADEVSCSGTHWCLTGLSH